MPFPTYQVGCHACSGGSRTHLIRQRAYELWEQAGKPLGVRGLSESWQDYFWKAAEKQVLSEESFEAAAIGLSF